MTSLTMHAAALGLWLYTARQAAKHHVTVIGNVDFIQVKKLVPLPQKMIAKPKPAQSAFDFLKMALPAVQHAAAPKMAEVKLPEERKMMQVQAPKLKDRGRLDTGPKLDMDLSNQRSLDMAKVEARIPTRKLAALSAMPRLEEVGRRQVANLPSAIAMEERRQEAMALQGMDALKTTSVSRHAAAPVDTIQEAAPPSAASKFSQKIASLLPESRLEMKQAVMPAAHVIKQGVESPVVRARSTKALTGGEEKKKGVEIEGPIADRKVTAYDIPEFPSWAKDQGVLEASVGIKFWVNREGEVLPNMRVEHTSGYGRLDRLAMESLAKWKFAPLISEEKQWGIITFRFLLE